MKYHILSGLARSAPVVLGLTLALAPTARLAAEDKATLVPGATIQINDSKGKFDFLEIDSQRHRLLAAHEKDETADFIDLTTNKVLARVKVGPAVGIAVDPKSGKYFVSVQDDKRVAVIDPESTAMPTAGPTLTRART